MKKLLAQLADSIHRADASASFSFMFWDGETIQNGERPKVTLQVLSPKAIQRMFTRGFLGFGEAFVAGDLEVNGDLQELLRLGIIARFDDGNYSFLQKARLLPFYIKTRDTSSHARNNIGYHYDLSNDFYRLFLDETMTYSCAYFRSEDDSLEQAQRNKYDHIARKLMLGPEDTILDVGCGWGGMLFHAALDYGVKGAGNTLSRNQYEYVCSKIMDLGLRDRIEVSRADYRGLSGKFDKFVSIGMFEHVGREYIPAYMTKVSKLLKKGGLGLLHTIGKEIESITDPWTVRYIFPGGYIPSLHETLREMGRAGFCILDIENLRMHYAMTLDRWIANFESRVGDVRKMFGEAFVRMWRLYLNASSVGFKYGDSRVYQILFSNGLNDKLPLVRDYMYQPK